MKVFEFLREKRLELANELFELIVKTYQKETERFLMGHRDPFENPVGSNFKEATWGLLNEIFGKNREDEIKKHLDIIIKIRAIQDFSPSEAIHFVLMLRTLIINKLKKNSLELDVDTLNEIFLLTDKLYLLATDLYMQNRELVWQIKFDEIMNRPFFHNEGGMCLSYLIKKGKIPLFQGNDVKDADTKNDDKSIN